MVFGSPWMKIVWSAPIVDNVVVSESEMTSDHFEKASTVNDAINRPGEIQVDTRLRVFRVQTR